MKVAIIYESKTGFTEKYAKWLGEAFGITPITSKESKKQSLKGYDITIYGGGVMAGNINGLKDFKKRFASEGTGKLFVFATGATPAVFQENIDNLVKQNFTETEQEEISFYYFQGGLNYEKMNLGSRMMIKTFVKMMTKKKDKTPAEEGMAQGLGTSSYDHSDKVSIATMVMDMKTYSE